MLLGSTLHHRCQVAIMCRYTSEVHGIYSCRHKLLWFFQRIHCWIVGRCISAESAPPGSRNTYFVRRQYDSIFIPLWQSGYTKAKSRIPTCTTLPYRGKIHFSRMPIVIFAWPVVFSAWPIFPRYSTEIILLFQSRHNRKRLQWLKLRCI